VVSGTGLAGRSDDCASTLLPKLDMIRGLVLSPVRKVAFRTGLRKYFNPNSDTRNENW
jgi:hypothetical protein